jgi:hypothetical protein
MESLRKKDETAASRRSPVASIRYPFDVPFAVLCSLFRSSFLVLRSSFLLQTARLSKRAAQEKFDLRVQAAQIVVRPALNGLEYLPVDPEQKRLPLSHGRY